MHKVEEHRWQVHGVDHAQYFPGSGVAFTPWDMCFVGIGGTLDNAFEDALENAAQCGYEVEGIEHPSNEHMKHYYPGWTKDLHVCKATECEYYNEEEESHEHCMACEMHWYVSLFIKEAKNNALGARQRVLTP